MEIPLGGKYRQMKYFQKESGQALHGSFSAVSKPIFATKYSYLLEIETSLIRKTLRLQQDASAGRMIPREPWRPWRLGPKSRDEALQ